MGEVVDTIALILFIIVLFIVIAGFNRQMVEKNTARKELALEREKARLAKIEETKNPSKDSQSVNMVNKKNEIMKEKE